MCDNGIKIDDLSAVVVKELSEYEQGVADNLKKEIKQVAKEAAQELKITSPKNTGVYASSWKSRKVYEDNSDIRVRVYNAKKPQITHLLENGYAKRNGGRVEGRPHIRPAEENAEKKLGSKVKVIAKGGL